MFKTIVVGVDGREGGRDALRLAAALAPPGANVIAVSAFPYFARPALAGSPAVRAQRDETKAMVDAEVAGQGMTARTEVAGDASPARALHRVAEYENADLIVVGSTHQGALGRVLVGDGAMATLHGAPCAVAIAPRGFAESGGPPARIGVGFDDSPESHDALGVATELAEQCGATMSLLRVVATPGGLGAEAVYTMDWLRDFRDEDDRSLRMRAADLPVKAESQVVIGNAVDELEIFSRDVDLLVVGSRGWGPVRRVFSGSTASGLARKAACPVLVVPRSRATGEPGEAGPSDAATDASVTA
jgi:nucleotide-binding universal stress UspA family protein